MQTAPHLDWTRPPTELIGFVAQFLAAGAIGFRYVLARARMAVATDASMEAERAFHDRSSRRAAMLGLVGAAISGALLVAQLPSAAARQHATVGQTLATNTLVQLQTGLLALALLGFALAMTGRRTGWPAAAVGVIVGSLRAALVGRWTALVNPLHVLAGGLWIGTLFVLVAAGLSGILDRDFPRERRGAVAADLVNGFSPLALTSSAVLVLFGIVTAWRHLKYVAALWTTPYGYALLVKLCIVAVVFAMGAWNWRRQRPRLGSEEAAVSIRRSSRAELLGAALVLIVTAVLVSLPAPKLPR